VLKRAVSSARAPKASADVCTCGTLAGGFNKDARRRTYRRPLLNVVVASGQGRLERPGPVSS
jgi:hypothetical protein